MVLVELDDYFFCDGCLSVARQRYEETGMIYK